MVTFATTPVMSTYLLAFLISDFTCTYASTSTNRRAPTCVFAMPSCAL